MTTVRTKPMRLVSLLGLIMMMLSMTPMGIAAQSGITPGQEVAQATGPAIELLVGQCPPDAPEDPSDLVPGCLEEGMANVNVQVTSTDPALGIDQPKVTERINNQGPGVINTGAIPLGEYRVLVDLPTDQYRFFFECRVRGTETDVPVSPSPDGATNAFLVTTSGTEDIVCSAFVTPLKAQPTIEITYRECTRADLPGDGRTFEDLDPNCTTISTDPPTFNVRDLNTDGEPVAQHQLDAEGKFKTTLAPGNYDFFTDLEMDTWGEYLFCEYEGQPRYEKEFDPQRGIVTFTDLLPGEEITCDWFAVEATDAAAQTPTVTATAPATETAVATETVAVTQTATVTAPAAIQAQADQPTLAITYRECTRGDMPSDGRTYQDLDPNCVTIPTTSPTLTLSTGGQQTQHTLDAQGVVTMPLGAGDNLITTGLNPDEVGQYFFCEYEGQPLYEKAYDPATGGFTFVDIANEQIRCDLFVVSASDTPTGETPAPTATTAPQPTATTAPQPTATTAPQPTATTAPVAPAQANGSINVKLVACETEDDVTDTSSLEAFRTNCTTPTSDVSFTLTNDIDPQRTAVTDGAGLASFADVPASNWRLWSGIPLEAATEYYFCADDSGTYNAVQLSERGVASFNDFNGQNITCEIYVVPENLRGDVTGASIEVHLSACPIGYTGNSWYNDCHANGVDGQSFTITGPNGEQSQDAVITRTPGPAVSNFTSLPAGDYVLAGGPPQDFGSVFLYCSDPATNTQVTTQFVDGRGQLTLAENQSVVCDWYFVPEDQGAPAPTPTQTPEAKKAEIYTTMFVCPTGVNVAGSTFPQLDDACSQPLSNVPMTLQSPGGVPITANTGESGEGAIRFYDLVSGNYVLTPTLPAEYVSAAVYCDLDGGDVYQKALSNGATTFTNVDGELVSCSWFVTAKPAPQPQQSTPTGSITIREMLCEGDRATIVDWERECQPGTSGVSFTITSTGGTASQQGGDQPYTQTLTPNDQGVAVFTGLPNDYYEIKQSEGAWCRARAERVDAQSRVIVANGGNTDVFLYQCNQDVGLPNTGAGPAASEPSMHLMSSLTLGAAALPLFAIAAWQIRRWNAASVATKPAIVHQALTRIRNGYRYR